MSNKIMTFGATALTALTLTGVIPTSVFADTSNQNQAATQVEGGNIPDLPPTEEKTVEPEHPQESVEQSIAIGGQGIGKDASHASGFARVTLDVKDHKASLIKGSDYCFHWSGWKSSKYASIKLTDPNGKVLYDQAWKGNESVKGSGYQKFGTFAQYDLPEGSTVEIYHAEGPWHRFHTSKDAELKNKSGKAGYNYVYKMQNNQLVLQSVDEKHVEESRTPQTTNLFANPTFKVVQNGNHWNILDWNVALVDGLSSNFNPLKSFESANFEKKATNFVGNFHYEFEDGSNLYQVGNDNDLLGINDATKGVTIVSSGANTRSSCFAQTINTKAGQKYHFSIDVTPNKVEKSAIGGTFTSSEFMGNHLRIGFFNEDGSALTHISLLTLKRDGNTYSADIPAKSNKTTVCILGDLAGNHHFYSAKINNISLTEK